MHERQAVGGLHDAEHELPGDPAALLVHAEGAQVVRDMPFAMDAHGGQVVENDGELVIDQRPDLPSQFHLDPLAMVHQRIHGAQKVLMGDGLGHGGHGDGLQPAQAAELALRLAEAVEHHGTHERLDIELALAGAQGAPEGAVEAEVLPQLVQGEDVSKGPGRRVGDLELCRRVAPGRTTEPPDQGVEMAIFHAVDAPEIGDDPVPRLSGLIAVGLDHLQVAPPAGKSGHIPPDFVELRAPRRRRKS